MPLSSPASNSQHIPQFISTSCIICIDTVDESLQATNSHIGPSLSHSDFRSASPKPIIELPMVDRPSITVVPLGSYPMLTQAKVDIFKTRHSAHLGLVGSSGLIFALLASTKPKGFKSAAKNPVWLTTMDEEVQALQNNRTWILVPRPIDTNIVGSKWVFRTKYLPEGSIECFKARLVAKGYTQVPSLDYIDTFSPIITATTIHVVFSLVVTNKWPIRQLDHLSADGPLFSDSTLYRSLVGVFQYLTITRPDISHVVNFVGQFLYSPTKDHFLIVKRILRYVKGTRHFGLTFHPSVAPGVLVAYSNADWAGCLDTRRSTFGYSIYLGSNLLMHLLGDLKVSIPQWPLLLCDNKSDIFLSSNPISRKQAKHVELNYHFLCELVLTGKLRT
ncbi:Retrovirus-related Pol polyprotein from transposon RE1 [Vitis vinifera]|uniref:Retrovirus-related Pol polyprotein from transposon RE1 n=1 Tax=Vitis vinifera TaxID=29760 RepID=A0A438E5E6_VITVI|nr:Retrovirus-related Pol polyprotein from transposon RE1 [Vitis vinifera]